MNDCVTALTTRARTFIDKALDDANCLEHMICALEKSVTSNEPVKYTIQPGSAQGSWEVLVDVIEDFEGVTEITYTEVVLSVINYHLFPVTAILDSMKLSQNGKLDDALDTRPLMFSGPAPTMIIWAGSDWANKLDYPELCREDVIRAFNHWLSYIFGVTLSPTNTVKHG